MSEFLNDVQAYVGREQVHAVGKALLIVIIGFTLSRVVNRRLRLSNLQAQQSMILKRIISITLLVISAAWALSTLGFEFGVVLGAAGVLTVAIGFAAQTSVSNLISGAFLMAERPFAIKDVIEVGGITGEVLSIDSLSVKLRTFNNLLVRIPNETMLKANITNYSHFPIRRYDMKIGVAYHSDIDQVREVLVDVARKNPLCLSDPQPMFLFNGFADSALDLQFSFWSAKENYMQVRTSMHEQIKRAFEDNGIEIPFPQRDVHMIATSAATETSTLL